MQVVRCDSSEQEPAFIAMTWDYVTELRARGSEMLPTDRTMEFWRMLFRWYVSGEQEGVVLIAVDDGVAVGFSIAGSTGTDLYDTDMGKMAYGWGTWVQHERRREGIADALRDRLRDELRAMKFETVLGGVHRDNAAGRRSMPRAEVHQVILKERL